MAELPSWYFFVVAGLVGAVIGSFLNVCIVRLPRGESIVVPRSHCAKCRHPLSWWENIPVVSMLFLRGRCRHCRRPISWRYPLVELITIFLSLLTWYWFNDPLHYIIYFLFLIAPLIAIAFIDLEHLIIPDTISLPGIFIGLGARLLLADPLMRQAAMVDSLLGILVGGGGLFVVAWGYEKLKKQEGLGGGDVKLMAMLGAFFGWRAAIFTLLLSSVLGLIVGLTVIILFRKDLKFAIPFGPFLATAGIIYLFVGSQLVRWYLALLPF